MKLSRLVVIAAAISGFIALPEAGVAHGDDAKLPSPGDSCSAEVVNAQTFLPKRGLNLTCVDRGNQGYKWQDIPFHRPVTRWMTFGPKTTLVGDAAPPADVVSGEDWVGIPQDADSQCVVEQQAVAYGSTLDSPEAKVAPTGQAVLFRTKPDLFSIEFSGHCFWLRFDQ